MKEDECPTGNYSEINPNTELNSSDIKSKITTTQSKADYLRQSISGLVNTNKEKGDFSCSKTPIIYSKVKDVQLNGTSIVDSDGIANFKMSAITNEEIDTLWMN